MQGDRAAQLAAMDETEFRMAFRAWLDASYPADWRQDLRRPFRRLRHEETTAWIRLLNQGGWRCPAWPKELGGLDLSFRKQVIYLEELERVGAARVIDMGEMQLGPTIMRYGTDEQKQRYLPRIVSGEHVWCQGYSEPNSGSDLASLRTAALIDGEILRVTGQKTWTTHAEDSTHMFALVRTEKTEFKQGGISFLLIDMKSPGITVRPIRNIAGEAGEFCEVFLDNVEVPLANVVGQINQGWTVAKALLGYERVWIGNPAMARRALQLSRHLLSSRSGDQGLMDRYAELAADLHDVTALYRQACDALSVGVEPGPEVSMLKILASDLLQRITGFNVELGREFAGVGGACTIDGAEVDLAWQFYMSRPPTIFAGSNEIQKNILARAVLGLPAS